MHDIHMCWHQQHGKLEDVANGVGGIYGTSAIYLHASLAPCLQATCAKPAHRCRKAQGVVHMHPSKPARQIN